jgi:hypothetical protein
MPQAKPGDAARKVIMARADKRAAGLRPTIEALQASESQLGQVGSFDIRFPLHLALQ